MRSIRTFAYATSLLLSLFAFQPSLAGAQEAHGSFTLPHAVHWRENLIPAGDYDFSVKDAGSGQLLVLRNLSGTGSGAVMFVDEVLAPKAHEVSQLELISRNGQFFVRALDLPAFDMTLRFNVPSESTISERKHSSAGVGTMVASR